MFMRLSNEELGYFSAAASQSREDIEGDSMIGCSEYQRLNDEVRDAISTRSVSIAAADKPDQDSAIVRRERARMRKKVADDAFSRLLSHVLNCPLCSSR